MTDEPKNDINDLMDKDPLSLTKEDIDSIIAYQRKQRANREGGVKVKKESAPKVSLDLASLGLVKKADPIKRRF